MSLYTYYIRYRDICLMENNELFNVFLNYYTAIFNYHAAIGNACKKAVDEFKNQGVQFPKVKILYFDY